MNGCLKKGTKVKWRSIKQGKGKVEIFLSSLNVDADVMAWRAVSVA